ncbi:hypothetical protein ASG39_04675 [Rhizobium sp. Leaf371]|uniref:hypothetical protein n=1 Tax=Rhizobium sp. Leaf371 TaxID=1736355 RepID=UPI000712D2B1|nr:hypothetical protein [Rhizobium sp. Leaf371]KQS73016.1 hypothetical protein ASG39_04675 [Rhizobium sp. Leaf371]
METKYTLDNLLNDKTTREAFFKAYGKLIKALKKHGYNAAAMTHARNRKRIQDEIALLDF